MTLLRNNRRISRCLAALLVVWLTVGGAASGVAATQEEVLVKLRARRFQYNQDTGVMVAEGEVVVSYQDVVIRADRVVANLKTNDVQAEGNVVIEAGVQTVRGRRLDYNLDSRQGRISQAASQYTGPMVLGKVSVRAEIIQGVLDSTTTAREAFCTTCEGPNPVVYLTARELTVHPGDKIIGRHMSVWVGGRRIVTWPYFIIYIRERRASRLTPVVGFSEEEGYFVKTFYSYALGPDHSGFLRLDLMDRLGTGLGVEHAYRLRDGSGVAFLYRLDNKKTGGVDSRVVLSHQHRLGEVATRLYVDHIARSASPEITFTDQAYSLDAFYQTARSSTTVYQSYSSRDAIGYATSGYTGRVIHNQRITDALSLDLVADLSRTRTFMGASVDTDDELVPRLTLRYRGAGYTASLAVEGRIDLDGDAFTGDAFSFMTERLPELTVAADPRLLGKTRLVYQLQGGVGRFREAQGGTSVDAVRTDLAATIGGPLVQTTRGLLNLQAQARGSYYTTGDSRAFLSGRLDYTHLLTDRWQGQVGMTYQDQVGQTPFVFDRTVGRISQADVTLTYRRPQLVGSVTTSYDAVGGLWAPVVARVQAIPRPG